MRVAAIDLDPVSPAAEARRRAEARPDEQLLFMDGLDRLATALDGQAGLSKAGRSR